METIKMLKEKQAVLKKELNIISNKIEQKQCARNLDKYKKWVGKCVVKGDLLYKIVEVGDTYFKCVELDMTGGAILIQYGCGTLSFFVLEDYTIATKEDILRFRNKVVSSLNNILPE